VVGSEGSSARAVDPSQAFMSIGEVLAHLRAEFPDTTISKLRFLESEGLVEPERTPSGYRKYSWDDVSRLTYILTAQRDHYLPLRVIREHLSGGAGVSRPPLVAVDQLPVVQEPEADRADVRLSRAELTAAAGISDEQLLDLEQYGLLGARSGGYYDTDALEIARVVGQLAAYGLQARHLRGYRTAADREIGLFEQVVAPVARQRSPEAQARAQETVRELAALSLRLHAALVQAGLRNALGG
jgi:DNA-binding transcriptional MerR regulator